MKRYFFEYRDAANYKSTFHLDIDGDLTPGQDYDIVDLGYDPYEFFENHIGYTRNPEYDHNLITVVKEADKYNGIYYDWDNLPFLETGAKQFIDDVVLRDDVLKHHTFAVLPFHKRGLWIAELVENYGFICIIGTNKLASDKLPDLIEKITMLYPEEKPVDPPAFTDKYIVIMHAHDGTHTKEFTDVNSDNKFPKEQAEEFYQHVVHSKHYNQVYLTKIVISTHLF